MELDDLSKKIKLVGRAGLIASLFFLFAMVDNFVAGHREPKNVFRALSGTEQAVNGNVSSGRLKEKEDVVFLADSAGMRLEFQEAKGRLWRGTLRVSSTMKPGEYSFVVLPKGERPTKESPKYKVQVFADRDSYRRSFKSLFYRYTGVSPLWIALGTIPLLALTFGLSYYLSGRREHLLAQQGKAEIFQSIKKAENWEISFELGQKHGVNTGDQVLVYSCEGTMLGKAEVKEAFKAYAVAILPGLPEAKPRYVARTILPQSTQRSQN